jgi:hypothetical protein
MRQAKEGNTGEVSEADSRDKGTGFYRRHAGRIEEGGEKESVHLLLVPTDSSVS